MTHGLCMFDGNKRLVICNERYASLYRLPPELLKAGTIARGDHRASRHERHPQGRQECRRRGQEARRLGQAFREKISSRIDELADGRLIRVVRQPMHGRRLGRDPRGHHRAATARAAARHHAGAGKPPVVDRERDLVVPRAGRGGARHRQQLHRRDEIDRQRADRFVARDDAARRRGAARIQRRRGQRDVGGGFGRGIVGLDRRDQSCNSPRPPNWSATP